MDMGKEAKEIRKKIIRMAARSGSSHVGTSLSAVDILTALYFHAMRIDPKKHGDPGRDRFLLSKGHGCAALYATLAQRGFFPERELERFYVDGGTMPGHATRGCVPGVEASTGSLGHGLSLGAGIALGARMDGMKFRTFVLLGDGECNEGSVWEAAMFAGNAKLDSLVAIVDYNKLQAFGYTKEVMDLEPFRKKWESFGWAAREVDGHDVAGLAEALGAVPFEKGRPSAIIAHTVKGKGVSFMENKLEWHYKSPNAEQEKQAMGGIGMRAAFARKLAEIAREDPNVALITPDMGFSVFEKFRDEFPGRIYNTGIAEQNSMGIAAGLALGGKTVYIYSITPFVTMRPFEQVRVDVCYQNLPVKLVGAGGGLTYGQLGPTHHAIEDVALMRALPNMAVFCPGDPLESELCTAAAHRLPGPAYIRLGKGSGEPAVHKGAPDFKVGRAIRLKEGKGGIIVSMGNMLQTAAAAAEELGKMGIDCGVASMPTVKPLDSGFVVGMAKKGIPIITLEEHSMIGGLGSAVLEALSDAGEKAPVMRIALPDRFCKEVGSQNYLRRMYGLDHESVARKAGAFLKRQK